jgi:hypothetical protein
MTNSSRNHLCEYESIKFSGCLQAIEMFLHVLISFTAAHAHFENKKRKKENCLAG